MTKAIKPDQIVREHKVLKLRIIKPVNMTWNDFGPLLREVHYRVWRLANLFMSESYGQLSEEPRLKALGEALVVKIKPDVAETALASLAKRVSAIAEGNIASLNKQLRTKLEAERNAKPPKITPPPDERFSDADGALVAYVTDALYSKLKAETGGDKWKQVLKGERSLPTYKRTIPIPLRGGLNKFSPLTTQEFEGQQELIFEPRICVQPWPRLIVGIPPKDEGAKTVLQQLLKNPDQAVRRGWRQRSFELVKDRWKKGIWWLHVSYDFPKTIDTSLDPNRTVGVDVGFSCPMFAALSDGPARLGQREFGTLGAELRRLRSRVFARRRDIQQGGKISLEDDKRKRARSGHGVTRKLLPTEKLQGRVDNIQKTFNHRMSAAVVKFAQEHHAGVIQMEDLAGLNDTLRGTFLGLNWRYYELQEFIRYKAAAAGIEFKKVNPRYSSRRCACCGWIDIEFSRDFRDQQKRKTGKDARFKCKNKDCKQHEKEVHADYNAALNLAVADLDNVIKKQCRAQKIEYKTKDEDSLATEAASEQSK